MSAAQAFSRDEWGEARKQGFIGDMKKRLTLTREQEDKIQKIIESKKKAIEEFGERKNPPRFP